jgi:hypothetical protein
MLRQQDSLKLSNDVADSIAILNKNYGRVIDSLWTPVSKYLASLPEKYDLDDAYDKVRAAENGSLDQMAKYGPAAKALLTSDQIRKLPPFIALFLDNQAIRQIRPGRAGGGRGGFFGGPLVRATGWTPDDHTVSATMIDYFVNFVKTGNPNGSGLPTWPQGKPDAGGKVTRMRIDVETCPEPRERYLFLQSFYMAP